MRSHWLGREIHACRFWHGVLTSWSALTRRVVDGWLTTRIGSPPARADSSSVGETASARGRPSLEEGARRHERERRAHQTSGRSMHDELVEDDGLRVQRWANPVSAASALTYCFQHDRIVFSRRDLHSGRGHGMFQCLSSFGFQREFLEARGVAQWCSGARWSRGAWSSECLTQSSVSLMLPNL